MKKIIIMLLTLCLCFGLCACGKSESVIKVEGLIDALGTITLDSEKTIESVKQAYNALDDSEKKKVENYAVLESAIVELKQLKESKYKELYDQAVELEKTSRKQAYELYKQLPSEYRDVADKIASLESTQYKTEPFSSNNPEQIVENINGLMALHEEYTFTLGLEDKIELTLFVKCPECGKGTMVTVSAEQDEANEYGMLQKFGYTRCYNGSCSMFTFLYGINIHRQ